MALADRRGIVALVKFYLDEAGTHAEAPVLTVAGYGALPSQWKLFTKEWNATLRPAGIKCYHATDAQALKGEFKEWDAPKRDELVARLLPIIPKYAAGIAISIVMKDFNVTFASRPDLKDILGDPYAACFQWLVQTLVNLAQEHRSDSSLAFIHENNDQKNLRWVHSIGSRTTKI